MEIERELARHLRKLNKVMQKIVARSGDFAEFRKFLQEEKIQLAIYVVPMTDGKHASDELRPELTETDKTFLKQAGISF